ncbi:MAG: hypothetical protein K2N60_01760 [Oscillospiraceae bacterium]|nr:hypothetical protein [Oscillospiraceae bacterium]
MKGKRLKSLGGTVLIMVLTVMLVLIIMLMATLTVVSTASQRIYTKYEENQAYYTARSALDVFTGSMLADSAYIAYEDGTAQRKFGYTDDSTGTPTTTYAPLKQGEALQLDLYKIRSQNEDGIDLGYIENPVKGDGTFTTGTPEDENFSLSDTDTFTKNGTTYKGLEYIEYDVKLPELDDGSTKYGKMVDKDLNDEDGDNDKTDQIAKIKVEVLDRRYATDPSYTRDVFERVAAYDTASPWYSTNEAAAYRSKHPSQPTDPTYADLVAAIENGPRNKDYMKIKITSTVKMMGVDGVAIVIFETTEKDAPAGNRAITTTGTIADGSGAQINTAGGAATMDIGVTKVGDGNSMMGTLYTLGQFQWTSSTILKMNKGDSVVAMGGISASPNGTVITSSGDNSVMFLGGSSALSTNSAANIGDNSHKIPIIGDEIAAGPINVYGDMYVRKVIYTDTNNGKWNLNSGNLYVQDVVIPDSSFFHTAPTVDGDGNPVNGKINLGAMLSSGSVQLCTGYNVYLSSDPSTPLDLSLYDPIEGATTTSVDPFDINHFTAVKNEGKIYRQYTLPFQVDGQNTIEIPSAQAYFAEYFKDGAFHETTGDLKNYTDQSNDDPADPANAYSVIYSDAAGGNKDMWLLTAADMLEDYLELTAVADGSPARTITSMIDDAEISNVESFPQNGTITLDSGDKFYVLDSSSYSGKVTVSGSNGRLILLLPEGNSVNFSNFLLVTDNIDETSTSIKNGTTKAPKVDIYGGTGSKIGTDNNCLFTAYFIMPTGDIDQLKMGKQGISYDDGNGNPSTIGQVAIVGSVICKNFKTSSGNSSGIAYLDKNSGAESPGEPHLSVKASQYTRN